MAHAGAFMSIEVDGSLRIERGYVRPEDEPAADDTMGDPERTVDPETGEIRTAPDGSSPTGPAVAPVGTASSDDDDADDRSEEHTSELQSLMRISYAVFRLKKTKKKTHSSRT